MPQDESESPDLSTEELTEVGLRIGSVYELTQGTLTKEELEAFVDYCNTMESMGPLLDPSTYQGDAFKQITQARDRARTLLQIVQEGGSRE